MREILFRGKRLFKNTWVYGGIRKECECFEILPEKGPCKITVYRDTVGQYTGLTDKNGTKIFEGDIVQASLPATRVLSEYMWPLQVVMFRQGSFGLECRKTFIPLRSFAETVQFEIIGNVYDNPELMD